MKQYKCKEITVACRQTLTSVNAMRAIWVNPQFIFVASKQKHRFCSGLGIKWCDVVALCISYNNKSKSTVWVYQNVFLHYCLLRALK